jgi:flotillin
LNLAPTIIDRHYCITQEIYRDRKKFSEQVFKVASSDLVNMGITVVSYTIKDISDANVRKSINSYHFTIDPIFQIIILVLCCQGYLMALGMGRTAEVKRDARIGEAQAKSDAQIKEAIAEEQRMASRLENDIQIAKAQRDFEVKKAAYDKEVNAKVKWRIA